MLLLSLLFGSITATIGTEVVKDYVPSLDSDGFILLTDVEPLLTPLGDDKMYLNTKLELLRIPFRAQLKKGDQYFYCYANDYWVASQPRIFDNGLYAITNSFGGLAVTVTTSNSFEVPMNVNDYLVIDATTSTVTLASEEMAMVSIVKLQ